MGIIKKILLVDDNEITCYLNQCLLEEMGVAEMVVAVNNGIQALQYIKKRIIGTKNQQNKKDLLFLDLRMPHMDGFEFLAELEKLNDFDKNNLIIVILTAPQYKKEAQDAIPFTDLVHTYLAKPLEEKKVKDLIESVGKTDCS